jgi:DNA-binding NtrC family response regulator
MKVSGELIKILVVDDDKLIRWSLKEIFSQEGYVVDAVATAEDALKQAKNITYELIFSDLEINDENGIEMLRTARVSQPEAKIIIISALTRQQIEPKLGNLNIFSIIEKPFRSEQIKTIVKEALGSTNHLNESKNQTEREKEEKKLMSLSSKINTNKEK